MYFSMLQLSIIIVSSVILGAYFHEKDMLSKMGKGVIYTWTLGKLKFKQGAKKND